MNKDKAMKQLHRTETNNCNNTEAQKSAPQRVSTSKEDKQNSNNHENSLSQTPSKTLTQQNKPPHPLTTPLLLLSIIFPLSPPNTALVHLLPLKPQISIVIMILLKKLLKTPQ